MRWSRSFSGQWIKMRFRVCRQTARAQTLPYWWKSTEHQGLLLTKLCTHSHSSSSFPSLPLLSCFFLKASLYCSLTFLPYLHFSSFSPGRGAELVEECGRHSPCLTRCGGRAVPAARLGNVRGWDPDVHGFQTSAGSALALGWWDDEKLKVKDENCPPCNPPLQTHLWKCDNPAYLHLHLTLFQFTSVSKQDEILIIINK